MLRPPGLYYLMPDKTDLTATIDFEYLFNLSPNPYMLLDRDFHYVAVNEAYLKVTGREREELIGENLFEAFPADPDGDDSHVQQLRTSLERVLTTGTTDTLALIRYAIPRETPDGVVFDEHFWSATHTPLLDAQGEVQFILQHTVNVTELQQLKNKLREAKAALGEGLPQVLVEADVFRRAQVVQEANIMLDAERRQLRQLFEQAPGFMAVVRGPDHVFQIANEAYYQVVGRRDVISKPLGEALPEVEGQGFLELLDQVYTSGEPFIGRGMSVRLRRDDDESLSELFVDFIYQPLVEPDGSIAGIFIQGHDVTEQKLAQAQLKELNETLEHRVNERTRELEIRNRELQEFAYAASHDLKEPLRKISTFADLLQADHSDQLDEEGSFFLERMKQAALRMTVLINDLLSFSRVSTKKEPLRQVDLNNITEDVLSSLQLLIEETEAQIHVEPLPSIDADPTQMHQLLQNLIANALKFRRAEIPPLIEVRGTIQQDEEAGLAVCRLEVADNGIGFNEKYLDRIFSPFQRLHGRSEYEGTGMGLAICRRIVERHNGTLTAQSTPGEGSQFMVSLPVFQAENA